MKRNFSLTLRQKNRAKNRGMAERFRVRPLIPAMPALDESSTQNPNAVSDFSDIYDANDLGRELMMPAGEPAVAVIAACLLLGMVWFVTSGHFAGGSQATHTATAARSNPPSSLNASGGPIAPPAPHRSAG